MLRILGLALLVLTCLAAPAEAAPVGALLVKGFLAVKGILAAGGIGAFLLRTAASLALSALAAKLAPKPSQPGIRTSQTMTGGTNPEAFLLGWYATEGALVAPPMSHGQDGKTPNAFLNYVIELGGIPGQQLTGLNIDGEAVEILEASPHPDYGRRIGGRFEGKAWIRYYDGTQTAADPMLLAKYPAGGVRPWSADMVGRGICYAIVTFKYHRESFQGFPSVRFILTGIPLYDPRKDSTAGGSGPMRWTDQSTWAPSTNTAVQVYNILRGIRLPGGHVWGGEAEPLDLPYPVWAAAMAACDLAVADGEDGLEAQFRSGFEVFVEDEPFSVIEELAKAANITLWEEGGVWGLRVGGPSLPVAFLADDDIIITEPQEFDPFPAPDQTFNAITASHPDPASLWETRDAPPLYNALWEAEDGHRRLAADLTLPAVPYALQVQRLMIQLIADHRRMRRHVVTLPQDYAALSPGDVIAWTSSRNSYDGKWFEIHETARDPRKGLIRVSLREVDPEDYEPPSGLVLPEPIDLRPVRPEVQAVPGIEAAPLTILDAENAPRRAGIRIAWDPEGAEDAQGIRWAVRLAGETGDGVQSALHEMSLGEAIEERLPNTSYQIRARLVAPARPTVWTDWLTVTTPDVRLGTEDLATPVIDLIEEARQNAADAKDAAERIQNEVGEAIEEAIADAEAARDAALEAAGNADEILIAVEAAREDTEAFKLAAEAAEEGATSAFASTITARDATEAYRDASLAAQSAAELASTEAQTHASAAGGSATAAAGSATTAASHSTAAGNSATAAAARVLEATAARDAAQGHASAANTSATAAAASATAAGTSAAASQADRLAAQTARSGSEAARDTAVTASNTATTAASTATTQAGIATSARADALAVARSLLPSTFERADYWTSSFITAGGAPIPASAIVPDADFGSAAEQVWTSDGASLMPIGTLPAAAGRIYRLTARFKVMALSGAELRIGAHMRLYNGANAQIDAPIQLIHTITGAGTTIHEITRTFSSAAAPGVDHVRPLIASGASLRAGLRCFNTGSSGTATIRVGLLRWEDVTDEVRAANSAAASATSATTAASHATAAGTSAAASQTDRLAAQAARSGAEAAQSAAVTARNDATSAATTASTQASLAASARLGAEGARDAAAGSAGAAATSATAANTSAGAAAASATAAGSSASAANTSRLAAETAQGQAQIHATSAATSATNAAGSANTATTQAGIATSARADALAVARSLLPSTFERADYWTNTFATAGAAPIPASAIVADTDFGSAAEQVWSVNGQSLQPIGTLPAVPGRIYRLTVRFKVMALSGGALLIGPHIRVYDGSGAQSDASVQTTHTITEAGSTIHEITRTFSSAAAAGVDVVRPLVATGTSLRAGLRFNSATASGVSATIRVGLLRWEDVTDEIRAANSAAASATSATTAASHATAAGTSAAASQTDRLAAQAARSGAEAAQSAAVTARNDATSAATTATNQATLAATARLGAEGARDDAAGSAGAAATSATAANTSAGAAAASATAAGTSAAASQADRLAAQTARSGSEAARDTAVTAATGAATSAMESLNLISRVQPGALIANGNFDTGTLALWNSSGGITIGARSTSGSSVNINAPSPYFAQFLSNAAEVALWSQSFPVEPAEQFVWSLRFARPGSGGHNLHVAVEWLDAAGVFLSATSQTIYAASVTWTRRDAEPITAPANAKSARLRLTRAAGLGVAICVGDIRLSRADPATLASVAQTYITSADADTAIAGALIEFNATVDGGMSEAVSETLTRVDNAEGVLSVLTAALTSLGALSPAGLAQVIMQMSAESSPSGVVARIGLRALAGDSEDETRVAAMFLEALAGGQSRVVVHADRFIVTDGTNSGALFMVSDGQIFLNADMIRVTGNMIVNGAVSRTSFGELYSVSMPVTDTHTAAAPGWVADTAEISLEPYGYKANNRASFRFSGTLQITNNLAGEVIFAVYGSNDGTTWTRFTAFEMTRRLRWLANHNGQDIPFGWDMDDVMGTADDYTHFRIGAYGLAAGRACGVNMGKIMVQQLNK